jgi:hypothetical protein
MMMERAVGLEPTMFDYKIGNLGRSPLRLYPHRCILAGAAGLEPATVGFGGHCSPN